MTTVPATPRYTDTHMHTFLLQVAFLPLNIPKPYFISLLLENMRFYMKTPFATKVGNVSVIFLERFLCLFFSGLVSLVWSEQALDGKNDDDYQPIKI